MKANTYVTRQDGEEWDITGTSKMSCCDCKLTHVIQVRVVKGRVKMRAWRDPKATAARRRKLR